MSRPTASYSRSCHYCGPTDREVRPYGPGGAPICFDCMQASPDREIAAAGAFGALLEAAEGLGPVVFLSEDGPIGLMNVDTETLARLTGGDA